MARAIAAIMASVLFVVFAEAGRAADLSETYTFKRFRIYHHLCNKRERNGPRKHGDR